MITAAIESSSARSPAVGEPPSISPAVKEPADAGGKTAQHVDRDEHAASGDARPARGFGITADRIQPAAPTSQVVRASVAIATPATDEDGIRNPVDGSAADGLHALRHPGDERPVGGPQRKPRTMLSVASVTMNGCGTRP